MSSIYRFRKVSDFSVKELMNDEVWGSTLDNLNDPFEGRILYDKEKIANLFKDDNVVDNLINKINIETNIIDKIKQMNYIASFTRNSYKDELMWAHYGDQARGFALEYEEDNIKNISNILVKEVSYEPYVEDRTKDILDIIDNYRINKKIIIPQSLANDVHFSKSKSWFKENEIRLLLKRENESKHSMFFKMKPKSIYIGEKCSDKDKYMLYSIANKKEIDLYQVEYKLKDNKYNISRRKIEKDEIEESLSSFCFDKSIIQGKIFIKKVFDMKIS